MAPRSPVPPRTAAVLCLLGTLALSACAPAHPPGRKDLFLFLHDGTTTRDEVKVRLGWGKEWVGGALWTYRVGRDSDGYYFTPKPGDWSVASYSLVLEFGPDGILRRHALVNVERQQ